MVYISMQYSKVQFNLQPIKLDVKMLVCLFVFVLLYPL